MAALAPLVANLIKPVVGRSRPLWEQELGAEASLSYPSGHATAGIAMGLSRLVLGVHWPSDVVGGWGVALAVAGTVCAILVLPPARDRHP